MKNFKKLVKNMILFSQPQEDEKFVLEPNKSDKQDKKEVQQEKTEKHGEGKKKEPKEIKKLFEADDVNEGKTDRGKKGEEASEISKKLSENLSYIKKRFHVPINSDIVIREFDIVVKEKVISAFMIFIDGMTDRKVINDNILQPLMLLSNIEAVGEKSVSEYIHKLILPHNQLKEVREYQKVIDEVNFGGCGIFVDGIDSAFAADVKGWGARGVERPNTELVIRGPQEGFNETVRTNTALIRKRLKDEDLIVESIEIGVRSKTPCSLLYIKDIANESLVNEVRRRLKGVKIDYLQDSGELEQFIEDNTFMPAPQINATERPDKVAAMLTSGKVAVVVHGSPFVLVMPVTMHSLLQSSEDNYTRFPYGNLLRIIRFIGIIFSLLLPGIYVAITNFHQEMIPTDLLFAIEAAREKVPFPTVVEILIMELAFELIREAGIRIPGPIGPTLGIIGALILGQAAVAANIVSPILIIIVAVTGIGSFAIPSFSLAFSFRILRFGYIILAAMAGFLGLTTGIFIQSIWFVSAKSFGVPYLTPLGPKTKESIIGALGRKPVWMMENRPDYVNPKDERRQPGISREWMEADNGEGDNNEE